MKSKLIYVPTGNLDKELFIKEVVGYKEIDFIGSVEGIKPIKRFIRLYNPDHIVFYSSKKSLPSHLKWCAEVSLLRKDINLVFILDQDIHKYAALCLRAGANYIFSTSQCLKDVVKSLKINKNIGRLPTYMLRKFVNVEDMKHGHSLSSTTFKEIMRYLAEKSKDSSKKGKKVVKIYDFVSSHLDYLIKKVNAKDFAGMVKTLQNEGFLTKNGEK